MVFSLCFTWNISRRNSGICSNVSRGTSQEPSDQLKLTVNWWSRIKPCIRTLRCFSLRFILNIWVKTSVKLSKCFTWNIGRSHMDISVNLFMVNIDQHPGIRRRFDVWNPPSIMTFHVEHLTDIKSGQSGLTDFTLLQYRIPHKGWQIRLGVDTHCLHLQSADSRILFWCFTWNIQPDAIGHNRIIWLPIDGVRTDEHSR